MRYLSINYAIRGLANQPALNGFGLVRWLVIAALAVCLANLGGATNRCFSQDNAAGDSGAGYGEDETSTNEKALNSYADAANFQTQGELKLAIGQWKSFLTEFADDPMAPRAAHYLGVCYMQLPEPDYQSAANAFSKALQVSKYGLREESLSNLGWCLYAQASNPTNPQPTKLDGAIRAFEKLLEEFPASNFADRALFYHGEALYAQNKPKEAIAKYDQLLKSRFAKTSSMRCDALYAKGIAHEDLKQYDAAIEAYRSMLTTCAEDPLVDAVKTQLAEVLVLQNKFAEANDLFQELIAVGGDGVPRALYRRAFVMTQLKRPDEAAALYDRLVKEYPDSEYAASAIMSAAQGYYLSGDFDEAKTRFEKVMSQGANLAAATEAAHWLSVMAMRNGDAEQAEAVARRQIAKGVDGPYATTLKIEAAEAAGMQPGREGEALVEFESLLAAAGDDPLLARILYNAAFIALQLGQAEKALKFTDTYFKKLPNDPLSTDMYYIAGESNLLMGNVEQAVTNYDQLLEAVKPENPRYGFWLMRASTANFAAQKFDSVIGMLEERMSEMQTPALKAESYFLIGSSYLSSARPLEAVNAFEAGLAADPSWRRADEMLFRQANAYSAAEKVDQAIQTWKSIIARFPTSKMSDQARYQLGQQALMASNFDEAVKWYDELLRDGADPVLQPYALYGKGRTNMQRESYEEAIEPFSKLVEQFPQHGFYDDALLARGMSYRRLDRLPQAESDLTAFLALEPTGINLGNALLELAIIDRERGKKEEAIASLKRIVDELPDYPEIAKVRYELGELLREAGKGDASMKIFAELIERNPDSSFASDASYKIGQQYYANKQWQQAAEAYQRTALVAKDPDLLEKSLYRLGWCFFQQQKFAESAEAFKRQARECPDGSLSIDALMMVGECYFNRQEYEQALATYQQARKVILQRDGDGRQFSDSAEQQVRELVFLHGGQSSAQLERWQEALEWYEALRKRYPSSSYLSQVFYETGLAHKMSGNNDAAVKFFTETANTFRDESSARARFMIGQIYFEQEKLAEAITEFKRVMYGYGAEKAPEPIRDWQAKSGFEAGRCAERLIQINQGESRKEAIEFARKYYEYVGQNHPSHSLASRSRDRVEVLKRL